MQLDSSPHIPHGLIAATLLLNEKPRHGLRTSWSTLHPGFTATQSTTALRDNWSVASGTRWMSLSCEFGACGTGIDSFTQGNSSKATVALGTAATICVIAEPCGLVVDLPALILGAGVIAIASQMKTGNDELAACNKEWIQARAYCSNLMSDPRRNGPARNVWGGDFNKCVRGQVSQRCGGNRVN